VVTLRLPPLLPPPPPLLPLPLLLRLLPCRLRCRRRRRLLPRRCRHLSEFSYLECIIRLEQTRWIL